MKDAAYDALTEDEFEKLEIHIVTFKKINGLGGYVRRDSVRVQHM